MIKVFTHARAPTNTRVHHANSVYIVRECQRGSILFYLGQGKSGKLKETYNGQEEMAFSYSRSWKVFQFL